MVIIILGLHIAGLFKIGFLNYEKKFHLRNKPLGYLGSFLVGIAFAFGWTPCIGPILGTILAYASTEESLSKGIYLLTIYSVGLAIPFFVTGIATNLLLKMLHKIRKFWGKIEAACGILLIIMGILLLTNKFQSIAFLFL